MGALDGGRTLALCGARFLLFDESHAARFGLYHRDCLSFFARRPRASGKAARVAQRDDSLWQQILFSVSARRRDQHGADCASAKDIADPQRSSARSGRANRRGLRLLLFSTGQSIRTSLLQPQTTITRPADFAGAVSNFWNVDLVQSWNGWRVANRSGSGATGRNRSSLFYVGAAIAFHRGGVFHTCF